MGHAVDVDSQPDVVVGVMPREFRFVDVETDLIAPLTIDRGKLTLPGFAFECVGRVKAGVTIPQARADIARLVPVWMRSWPAAPGINPKVYESWLISPDIRPLKDSVVGSVGKILWVVMGTIGIVMLIVAANVANLLLVRAQGRQQEFAVRAALGAGRRRIAHELLVESLLLSVAGGVMGTGVAAAGLQLLRAIGPGNLPRFEEISLDIYALGFALAVSLVSGVLFGLLPAFRYAGSRISLNLRRGGRSLP